MNGHGRRPAIATGPLLLFGVLLLSGCTSAELNPSVALFQSKTHDAVVTQRAQLAALQADENARNRGELATRKASLIPSAMCVEALTDGKKIGDCRLIDENGEPIEQPVDVDNIGELGQALDAYAKSLGMLAGDVTADQQAFSNSATDVLGNIGALEGAIAAATGSPSPLPKPKLDAVAVIASQLVRVASERQRAEMLRRSIVAADPFVQEATGRLATVDEVVALHSGNTAFRALLAASQALEDAKHAGASVAEIAAKQGVVFARMVDFTGSVVMSQAFVDIGTAHGHLAEAAANGASPKELLAIMTELLDAASKIKQAAGTIGGA